MLLSLIATGCGEMGVLDELPAAALLEPYQASLESEHAKPPIRYDLFEGELPRGLELSSDGTLSGTPEGAGTYEFSVRAVDDNDHWTVATLHLDVTWQEGQVFLGPVMGADELNDLCLDGYARGDGEIVHLMCQPWVRIEGAGMANQTQRQVTPGVFWVGENGQPDGGWFDDLLLRELDPLDIEWSFAPGESWPEAVNAGPNRPDGTDVDATGVLTAGEATGPGAVEVVHERYGTGAIDVLVVPPDFCPAPQGC